MINSIINCITHEILILYASQTGTAKYVAEEIFRELCKRNFTPHISAFDSFDMSQLPFQKYVIFIVSTTGQGEVPDNMKNSWKFLLIKELPNDALEQVNFTIFGLGDSSYSKFNSSARKLYQRLIQLSAKEIYKRGLGDDQHEFGYESELIPWLEGLWESLRQYFPSKNYDGQDNDRIPYPMYIIEIDKNLEGIKNEKEYESLNNIKNTMAINKDIYLTKISKKNLLTAADHDQEVYYIELEDKKEKGFRYRPGDVAIIQPRNNQKICSLLIEIMGLDANHQIKIKLNPDHPNKFNVFGDVAISIGFLFKFWLNIMGTPTKYFFEIASHFTQDELHKEKLKTMGSRSQEGKVDYTNYCYKEKRNIYEILYDFNTVKLPLNYLIEAVGIQKSREFSICTSNIMKKNRVNIFLVHIFTFVS